jgi:oxygen-dependent protoporphyrinogen oxidase
MPDPKQVIVIGAGISGLACAYRLQKLGARATLLESSAHPGGVIRSERDAGFLFEYGPQSFQGTAAVLELVPELGVEQQLQTANPRAPRYVLKHGRLEQIPMSPQALLASRFLGARSRWKIATEAFRRTAPPSQEESVAAFVRRKFGHEILEYLVSPFVSGVYAGDPEQLSLKAAFPTLDEWERQYGSVVRGAIKSKSKSAKSPEQKSNAAPPLCSFADGVATLPRTLAAKLADNLHTETTVVSIDLSHNQKTVHATHNGTAETYSADAIVIATPAYVASHLVRDASANLADVLSGIAYAPVAVVCAGYRQQQIGNPLEGFGFLVPRSENVRTLGTVWNSSLFPSRASENSALVTSFIGGSTDLEIIHHSESEIANIVHADNARILDIAADPLVTRVSKYEKALPQYNLGHGYIVESIRAAERATPGLFFAGNYLEGPSLGKCLENGFATADSVFSSLSKFSVLSFSG